MHPHMNTTALRRSLLASAAGLCVALPAFASDEICREHSAPAFTNPGSSGFDPETGRDLRNFPPHRTVDSLHMLLRVRIADMNKPVMNCTQELTVRPIAGPVSSIALDAVDLKITSVKIDGHSTSFTHDGRTLSISVTPPLPTAQDAKLITEYRVENPAAGIIWTPESPAWPGRDAQLHSQGETQTNSYWFPCHDFPNEKITNELIVTVPGGYQVSSNGSLVARERGTEVTAVVAGKNVLSPIETYRFIQDKPHSNYLVSLIVGKFDVVELKGETGAFSESLPMPVYVAPGRGVNVAGTFGRTPAMIDYFSMVLEEPYPWSRYAQLSVWNFAHGGMENTGATTLHDGLPYPADELDDHDADGLISHELAHQWFGDLITCASWEHTWLNEGFATYMTALWMGKRDGPDAYTRSILGNFDGIIANDRGSLPDQQGMASKVYRDSFEAFRRPANPYGKGSSILHMLRQKVGDAAFFAGIARYIDEHKFQSAETADLRKVMELVSGENLEQFFQQWTAQPGVPRFTATLSFNEETKLLSITTTQTQTINGDNPAFEVPLAVYVRAADGSVKVEQFEITGKEHTFTLPLSAEPVFAAIDPDLWVLAEWKITQPPQWAAAQVTGGPSLVSRIMAARQIAADKDTEARRALAPIAADPTQPRALRVECIRAIANAGGIEELLPLTSAAADHYELRTAIADGLASHAGQADSPPEAVVEAHRALLGWWKTDTSSNVRGRALNAMVKLSAPEAPAALAAALAGSSWSDELRLAALEATYLAPAGAEASKPTAADDSIFTLVINAADESKLPRTRVAACQALARAVRGQAVALSPTQHKRALSAIETCVVNGDSRTRRGAADALASIGGTEALSILERNSTAFRAPAEQIGLEDWKARASESIKK